ncbi:hypothetical protein OAK27_03315 [Acidimicrobiaceae bacterium]|nr:hypothetical protein [Acidimicrobiaceae bacterium]
MKNVTRMKFGALVIVGALFGAACSDSDNDLDEARAVLEEATEALANAEQARVDAEAKAAQAIADAAAAAAEAASAEASAAAAVAAAAEEAAATGDADALATAEAAVAAAELAEATAAAAAAEAAAAAIIAEAEAAAAAEAEAEAEAVEEEDAPESILPGTPGLLDLVTVGTIPLGILPGLLDLTCPGDPAPTDIPVIDWEPSWEVDIDGDGEIDYASIIDAQDDTGRWYLHVTSSWHDAEFYLDLGPDAGEVDFDIAYITDVNENDREEIWVYSMGMGGTHSPRKHHMVVLHGCSLTVVGSNIEGHEDQFTIWLGLAPTGDRYRVHCSTFEGEPLFTYHEDYPVEGGFWAISGLPFRLVGDTLELVISVELEGAIIPGPYPSLTTMNCPTF